MTWMIRRSARAAALLVSLWMSTGMASAQDQRASIEGVVKDNTGAFVPGAAVEARHLQQGRVASTSTDEHGAFRFPNLTPGSYEVVATFTGFTAARMMRVDVALGEIKRLELGLGIAGIAEAVQVAAEPPVIDVTQNQRSFSITPEQFEKLPRGRDFSTIVTQAPGANLEPRSGGITIDGSSASENRFVIDGVETTDPENGTQGTRMALDLFGEVQVKSSGYSAEFGGSTGGVINAITRSGTNAFRGDVGLYFTADDPLHRSDRRPTLRLAPTNQRVAEYVTYPQDAYRQVDPGFALGGPIMKDRLWFFGAYAPGLDRIERTANLSDGTPATKMQTDRTHYLTANVSGQFRKGATARVSYGSSHRTIDGILPNQNGSSSPLTVFDPIDKRPNYTVSGFYNHAASDRLFFGVSAGHYLQDQHTEGMPPGTRFVFANSTNVGLAGVPADLQRPLGFSSQSTVFNTERNTYRRRNVQADATYYTNLMGQHTFKGGVQFSTIGNDVLEGETWGNLIRLRWNQDLDGLRGQFGHYQVRSNGVSPDSGLITEGNVSNTRVGLFFMDTWTLANRLTLNLGLRTENEGVPLYTTEGVTSDVGIEWGFSDKLAPRLGFAWDVAGDGRTKVSGNWALYYDIFKMELPRGSFGGDKWLEYFYSLDTPNWPALDVAGCPPACPGTLIAGPIDLRHPATDNVDPDIKPMRQQEWVLSVERELTRRVAVSARYVHKQIDRAVEDIGSLDAQGNEIYTIGNPGFGRGAIAFQVSMPDGSTFAVPYPKAVRDYDAIELAVDRRLANRWSLRASYTWSRLFGNYSGLSQSDENGRTSPNVGRNFDYPVMAFDGTGTPAYGRLGTDRPHQFKILGSYELPFGTVTGLEFHGASGVPVTREVSIFPPNLLPVQYLGRGSDGRMPSLWQTDLFVGHDIRLAGTRVLQFNVTVLNLFDGRTPIDKYPLQTRSSAGINFDEVAFYNGQVDVPAAIAALGPTAIDPRFLMDRQFQGERTIRVGARFRF